LSINLAAAKKLKKMREAMLKTMKTRENSKEHEPAEANKTKKTKKQRQNLRKLEPAEAEKTRKYTSNKRKSSSPPRLTNEKIGKTGASAPLPSLSLLGQ
jgi:hypothetical protein